MCWVDLLMAIKAQIVLTFVVPDHPCSQTPPPEKAFREWAAVGEPFPVITTPHPLS